MSALDTPQIRLEMVCTCDMSGVREAEERRLRIFEQMGLTEMSELTSAIILSLAFDFQADAEVYADQWFGVSLRLRSTSVQDPKTCPTLFVECDHPADGLARLWEYLWQKYPELPATKAQTDREHVRQTKTISDELLKACAGADMAFRQHREPHKKEWCEQCNELMNVSAKAHCALENAWGYSVLNPAIERAFGDAET